MTEIPTIDSEAALERLLERSGERPVLVFKHSLTCPISASAHRRFCRFVESGPDVEVALIEVQRAREVSNALATRMGVRHESPQAILVHRGEAVWHTSHGWIQEEALARAVAQR